MLALSTGEMTMRLAIDRCKAWVSVLLAAACMLPLWLHAQGYPVKPVHYIVPFSAGASPDIVARLLAERLTKMWGQQVLVENRVGAGGTVGAAFVAKSPPDGYTLFQCNIASSAIAESLYAKAGYNHQRDFAPISRIGTTANVLFVHPSLPAKTMKELIAYARTHPGKLSYGASPAGTSPQLTMELLKMMGKMDMVHVPYKDVTQAVSDVIGGQIPVGMSNVPGVLGTIQSRRVRALGVTSLERISQLSEVPTMNEGGFPGFEVTSWYGLCAPSATPTALLDKLHADLVTVLRIPEVQRRMKELVVDVAPTSREEFAQIIRSETARWAKVVKAAGITVQ
jgi:tripartite-type tricarboxylate transporter receptor subunit TctC